jgi:hypothetical protein
MLRIAALLAVLAAFPAAGFAAPKADTPAGPPTLVAKLAACDLVSADRAATFYARMDTQLGAAKMQIRFLLLERLGRGSRWGRLDVPALKQWHTSQIGVKRFGWKQTVDALRLGGAYKARVQYRWLSATGAVLDTETRETPACRGPLPNLALGALSVNPGPTADTRSYRVEVSNRGKIAAKDVVVALSVDKAMLDAVTISNLAVGETRVVNFTGPVCRHVVHAKADPENTIGESLETDNTQQFVCS